MPSSFTDLVDSMLLLSIVSLYLASLTFLFKIVAWNLSALIIISFWLNQLTADSNSCFKVFKSHVKEVWYNCSAHRSACLFIIEISSHNHIKWKQTQRIFLKYSGSVTIINIVKKHLWQKIHELNTMIGCSDNS